ncbi:hypothetical protein [Flavobacterium bizetiae]|uniref:hypothetical protein n=1 Tax=Flavobacterium bizetiae TaxID=2704140 RepID=UPI00375656B2
MKKIIISILLPIFIGCTKSIQEQPEYKLVLNSAYHIDQRKDSIATFRCSADQDTIPSSVLKIKFINQNLIAVACTHNSGYGGEDIVFQLRSDLSISNVKFDYASDTEGGKTETYKIEKFKLTLNRNPFKEGVNNLQGEFSLEGKIKVDPDSWFKPSFEEDLVYSSLIYCK